VPQRQGRGWWWSVGAPLVVLLVAFLTYVPTLSFSFLNWDDPEYILNNPWIRGWSLENLGHVFTRPYSANFLPLHLVSYMLDYSFWKLNPLGYHLQSVLLQALNSVLAVILVRGMFGNPLLAFLAGLFFAVHPSHVEAVAWISIRKDLLSTTFALLATILYLRATTEGSLRWRSYGASVLAFLMALLSKVSIVTLPIFFLILDRLKSEGRGIRPWKTDLGSKVPYALLGLWLTGWNAVAQTRAKAAYAHSVLSYAAVKGHAAWNYLALLLGTRRGSPDYDLPLLGTGATLVSLPGLVVLPLGAWIAYRLRNREVALGVSWIAITLLPALLFPLVTYMADRYLYLPSLGFCWIVAAGILALAARVQEQRFRAVVVIGLGAIVFAGFTARTIQALPVWRNSESLWTYALTRVRDFRAYTNLAEVRLAQGRLEEAERLLKISARVENATTYQNLGVLYFQQGRYGEAAGALERALGILRREGWNPAQASILYYSLGAIYWRMGAREKTIGALEAAVREDPANHEAMERLESIRSAPPSR
jgi:protein O-mannosyl-transferase